jgi:uncharacterized membrane protein YgcG
VLCFTVVPLMLPQVLALTRANPGGGDPFGVSGNRTRQEAPAQSKPRQRVLLAQIMPQSAAVMFESLLYHCARLGRQLPAPTREKPRSNGGAGGGGGGGGGSGGGAGAGGQVKRGTLLLR